MSTLGWWKIFEATLLGILLFHGFCASDKAPTYTFMQNATSAPAISHYDYIIIGGGTAGCPLAATLSQNATVLLLERGGSPYGNQNISNLASFGAALSDLSPTAPSQRFVSEDGVINARARVLGGGSCLNAGFYTRASAEYVRAVGWDGRLVNESYEWVERVVAHKPVIGEWQNAVQQGLVEVGVVPYNGFTYDHIYGTKIGGTIFDENGHRHTAANLLKYAHPTRLTVLLHATVHRILFRTKGQSRPMAHGVVYRDETGTRRRAYLKNGSKNEIIISAGALGSPQILMLSGVGPAQQLKAHNISVVLDQQMVGQGMSDNPMNAVFVPSPVPVEVSLIQVVGITKFGSYIESASGANFAGTAPPIRHLNPLSSKIDQPKQGIPEVKAKDGELMDNLDVVALKGGFLLEKVMGPVSTGHLELRTRSPKDNPIVTFNYFKEPQDLERCVQGIATMQKVVESKAFSKFKYDMPFHALMNLTLSFPINLRPKHENSSMSIEQYCKDTVMTIWHYHGGCQVGMVVDHDYNVLGIDALRVIDGSTFNQSPGTNPQATVMMLGRYMGVKILSERLAN